MIYLSYPSGTPVYPSTTYRCTNEAERAAARNLGADWRSRGYRVACGPMPLRPDFRGPQPRHPRTTVRIGGEPGVALFTDWHKIGP